MSNLATIVNNILADSGIDDINVVVTTGSYTNPAWIVSLPWTKITGTPTTLAGYGITDAYTQTQINNLLNAKLSLSGGTMTGAINLPNGIVGINVGDDATISDRNVANTMYVAGIQNTDRGYINFSETAGNQLGAVNGGALTWRGVPIITTSNVSGTVGFIPKFTAANSIGNSIVQDDGRVITITSTDGTGARTTLNDVLTIAQLNPNAPYSGFGTGILFRGNTYVGNHVWGRIGMQLTDFSEQRTGENMIFQVAPADNSDSLTTVLTLAYNSVSTFGGPVGVGITPTQTLDVNGNGKFRGQDLFLGSDVTADNVIYIYSKNGAQSQIRTNAGVSSSYNGMMIASNYNQAASLPSWSLDLGGALNSTGNVNTFTVGYKPFGGAWASLMIVNANGDTVVSNNFTSASAVFNNGTNSTNGIKVVSSTTASVFTGGIEFIRTTVAGGSKIQPLRDAAIGGVGFDFLVTANNAAEISASYTSAVQILNTGAAIFNGSVTGNSALFNGNLQTNGVLTVGNQSVAGNYFLQITPSTTNRVSLQGLLAGVGISDIVMQPSGGSVGVGTSTSITGKFTVLGTQAEIHVKNDNTNTLTLGGWDGTRQYIKSINLGVALTPLTLQASSFNFDTGNVGINTTNPQAGLQVEKYGSKFDSDVQYNQPAGNVFLSVTGAVADQVNWFGMRGSYNSSTGSTNLLLQANYRDVNSQAGHYISSKAQSLGVADFIIGKLVTSTSVSTPPTLVPQLYMTSSGRVGINTITPNTRLEVFDLDGSGARTSPFDVVTITADNNSNPYDGFGGGILFKNRIYAGGPSPGGIRDGARIRTSLRTNSSVNLGTQLVFDVTATGDGGLIEALRLGNNSATFSNSVVAGSVIGWNGGVGALSFNTGVVTMETNSATRIELKTNGTTALTLQTNQTARFANLLGIGRDPSHALDALGSIRGSDRLYWNGLSQLVYILNYDQINNADTTTISDSTATNGFALRKTGGSSTFFFGNYTSFPPGNYTAYFRLKVASNASGSSLGTLDVVGGTMIGFAITLRPNMFAASDTWQYIKLPFTVTGSGYIEWRLVGWTGITTTFFDHIMVYQEGGEGNVFTRSAYSVYVNQNTLGMQLNTSGAMTVTDSVTATSFFESSDERLKSNIIDLDTNVSSIIAKSYLKNGMQEIGYLAQDVERILPSAISKRNDGYLDLSYRQVHTAKIAALEKEVFELKQQLKNK
jgi:hypothetical protein